MPRRGKRTFSRPNRTIWSEHPEIGLLLDRPKRTFSHRNLTLCGATPIGRSVYPGPHHSSGLTFLRCSLTPPRAFFVSTRLRLDASVGRVAIRRLGVTEAFRINSLSRSRAISRFRAWLRVSSHWMTIAPSFVHFRPASFFSRVFSALGRLGERSASNLSSTAVETLLTFCPPGPEARTKLSVNSQSAISISWFTRNILLSNEKGRPTERPFESFGGGAGSGRSQRDRLP